MALYSDATFGCSSLAASTTVGSFSGGGGVGLVGVACSLMGVSWLAIGVASSLLGVVSSGGGVFTGGGVVSTIGDTGLSGGGVLG